MGNGVHTWLGTYGKLQNNPTTTIITTTTTTTTTTNTKNNTKNNNTIHCAFMCTRSNAFSRTVVVYL